MSDPIYIHTAARTKSYGYQPDHGYSEEKIQRSLSRLLSIPANEALRSVPVPIDAVFVSNQLPGQGESDELVVNQLVDFLSLSDQHGKKFRLMGATCVRVETATNGLTALKMAIDHIQAHSGDTVLVIGGEKLTPPRFADKKYRDEHFAEWAKGMVEYIASALSPKDRDHCRCMPAAMGLILNYYAKNRAIRYEELTRLIEQLSIRAYENVLGNSKAFQRHFKTFSQGTSREAIEAVYKKDVMRVYPLRQLDMSPFNDGAGALLISRHRDLKMLNGDFSHADVAITGCAVAQDRLALTERERLDYFPATRLAARRAYAEAGLDLRRWQTTLAPLILEHHDAFVPLTLINLEDLLLFQNHQEVIRFLNDKYLTGDECPLWLNPSGGLLEGHPFAGTAVIKTVECFARLTGKADFKDWATAAKVGGKSPTTAIVQSFGGIGANVGVAVLDKCDAAGATLRARAEVPYPNRGTYVIEETGPSSNSLPGDGQLISIARVTMPFVYYEESFKEHFAIPKGNTFEVVLALVDTPQGKFYAFAPRDSEASKLMPEEFCQRDISVRLDKVGEYMSFSIKKKDEKSPVTFRRIAA